MQSHHIRRGFLLSAAIAALLAIAAPPARAQQADATTVAIYWYAMLKIPAADQLGPNNENGIPDKIKQTDWLNVRKNNGCVGCHQLGQLATRTIPKFHMDQGKTHEEAWMRRIQSGQAGEYMTNLAA